MTRRRWLAAALGLPSLPDLARSQRRDREAGGRHRVLVSTDIGGSDPDDFQSMVHFLFYADLFDVEGLVSLPWGPGRAGYGQSTEGSDWIIECARREDARPLYVLVWRTIEDIAQALHDDPSIKERLRVYFIGGPNKKWCPAAYNYIEEHHPDLWIVESNSTYRGWFVGGNQSGDLGNRSCVETHIQGCGALGNYFAEHLGGVIKIGDTPSVTYMIGSPEDPSQPGWGGRFVRAWDRPKRVFDRLTTADDELETFGLLEIVLSGPAGGRTRLIVDGQEFPGSWEEPSTWRFRFVPKEAKRWSYRIASDSPELNGLEGAFVSVDPPPASGECPSPRHPDWWTDDPNRDLAEGPHLGAVTVNRWREEPCAISLRGCIVAELTRSAGVRRR